MPTDPASPPDHPGDDDRAVLEAGIREALRAGPATAAYAELVRIFFIGSRAVIRGQVDDPSARAAVLEVVARVPGIDEVIDEIMLRDG